MRFHDVFTLILAVAVPLVLVAVFPVREARRVLDGAASSVRSACDSAGCAFVTLTASEESHALALARAAWQRDRAVIRHQRIDLFADTLPTSVQPPVLVASQRHVIAAEKACAPYVPDPLPPSLAAPPPITIASVGGVPKRPPAFSRAELLRMPGGRANSN